MKVQLCSVVEIQFFAIRKMVITMNSLWYFPKSTRDRMPTCDVSPTNLSISAIDQCCLESDPG